LLQSTAGRSSDWRLWRHGVAVVEAGVAGGGAAPPDCSSPRRISGPAGPLLSSPLSSLPFSLNWRGRGPRRARAGYTPAMSPARASPCHSRARASRLPLHTRLFPPFFLRARDFLPGVASVGRQGDAFINEATPYARKSWRAGRRDSEIARTTRRRLGDAMATP